jgi:hypothetical protein
MSINQKTNDIFSNSPACEGASDNFENSSIENLGTIEIIERNFSVSNSTIQKNAQRDFSLLAASTPQLIPTVCLPKSYTENEIRVLLDKKPEMLLISVGRPQLDPTNLPNAVSIALASPVSWRYDDLCVADEIIYRLADAIKKVVIIGDIYSTDKKFPFELNILAAALRRENLLVACIPELRSNHSEELRQALEKEAARYQNSTDRQFIALGYRNKASYFWSSTRQCVLAYSPTDMTTPGPLTLLCGFDWLKNEFGYLTNTNQQKVNYRDAGLQVMEECNKKGIYKVSDTYGTGVWRDPKDPDCLIVNNGDDIWRTDGRSQYRVGERCVYVANRTLNMRERHSQARAYVAQLLLVDLRTWNWRRACDPLLLLGWLAYTALVGAVDWRVHAALTGAKGTGKSSLLAMIKTLLGDFLIACSGSSTEPSIRRQVGNDSLAIIIDEAENDSPNIRAAMSYLRASSSGDKDMKANRNDGVDIYTVRSTGLISAVDLPQFLPADEGRYIHFSLLGAPKGFTKPDFLDDAQTLSIRGSSLQSRMIHSWPRYRYCLQVIRMKLIGQEGMTHRYADSLSTILSAAWVALNDGIILEDDATQLINSMDFAEEKEQLRDQADDTSFIDHALDTMVVLNAAKNFERTTLRMAINLAANGDRRAFRSVQMYGFKLLETESELRLLIDEKNPEFKMLFRDTKWNNVNFVTSLKRLPGVSRTRHDPVSVGGRSARAFSIPFNFEKFDFSDLEEVSN